MAKLQTPEDIFGDLFREMHRSELWPDGKVLADLIPKTAPKAILKAYEEQKELPAFKLKAFVEGHFEYTRSKSSDFKSDTTKPVDEHIESLWPFLMREADPDIPGSSLIPLPYPYIVPGGRFQEIYYWDSYFTMLGLLESDKTDVVTAMVKNFAHLIKTVGHIPNGNRTYYSGRSQPPFFACMVELLADKKGKKVYKKNLDAMIREYEFWMKGKKEALKNQSARMHSVGLGDRAVLNRYWDDFPDPRAEMYGDDIGLQKRSGRAAEEVYADIRAACESGWDFSSRWCADPMDLGTIEATKIIPVDLNCLLYNLEATIAKAAKKLGKKKRAEQFTDRANRRKDWIRIFLWDENQGIYADYNWVDRKSTGRITAASVFPLYFEIATEEEAQSTARVVETHLLQPGGLVTTPIESGQQWDAPNGWAPLQWIAIQGLRNYGFTALANQIKTRWINLNTKVYRETGKLMEKYDVMDLSKLSGGGEYPVQDGFGWTNGVLLALMRE